MATLGMQTHVDSTRLLTGHPDPVLMPQNPNVSVLFAFNNVSPRAEQGITPWTALGGREAPRSGPFVWIARYACEYFAKDE
jgi:hypothetical protein